MQESETRMDDNDKPHPDDHLLDKLEAVLKPNEMADLMAVMLDYQMLMNQYVMEVHPEIFAKAREYADDYVNPRFHGYREVVRVIRDI